MSNGRVPASCPPNFSGRYTVRAGDSMFLIAQRFGVSLNALIAANPHISNPAILFAGDVLCVPGSTSPDCRVPTSCPPGFQGRYTVRAGDSMYTIAQRFGVSLNALIAANPQIPNPNQIHACDVLCVPGTTPPPDCRVPTSCPPGFQGRYTVRAGDSMYSIAQRYGVSLNALIAANPQIPNPNQIHACDVLCVPGTTPPPDCRVPTSCPPGFQGRYTVRAGDSMYSIAQRYGVSLNALIAANPQIPNPNQIHPCDVLCVPGTTPPPDCRVPTSCPPGFQGRYTVRAGDSMYSIAQRYGVSLNALIAANPQIPNPNQIHACDVLCVPGTTQTDVPRVALIHPPTSVLTDAKGSALVRFLSTNQRSISILGVGIPAPQSLGNFNSYQAVVSLPPPEDAIFEVLLSQTPVISSQPSTWSGSLNMVIGSGWPLDTLLVIRPVNTNTGATGSAVLTGTLNKCTE